MMIRSSFSVFLILLLLYLTSNILMRWKEIQMKWTLKEKLPSENMGKNSFFFHQCKPLPYTIPWSSRKWNIRIGMTLTENRHFNYFFLFAKIRVLSRFEFQFRYSTNIHLWELILSISLVMEFIQRWVKIKYIILP